MKKIHRVLAMLMAAIMALSLITTAFAEPTIDPSKKASLSIYKYDITKAGNDGAWDAESYVSTGLHDNAVVDKLSKYAIQGVEFTYIRVADVAMNNELVESQRQVGVLYGFDGSERSTVPPEERTGAAGEHRKDGAVMGNRKLPFGYKMVMGEIVVHPQEAQAVQGIYARYLAGASFNDITDHLKEKGPPYDADKPWNKNMVARILEDNRYAGTERFPAILSAEQLQEAAQHRSERKPAVQITEAQKVLRRLCNGRPSAAVESQVLSLLNCLAAAPEQIKPQPQAVNRGELAEMERRFSAALATSPVDEDGAKELALRLAGMQYSSIGSSEYESQRLRHLFTSAAPMAEIDAELLKSTVSQVYVKKGQASLLLKNGQIIERS